MLQKYSLRSPLSLHVVKKGTTTSKGRVWLKIVDAGKRTGTDSLPMRGE